MNKRGVSGVITTVLLVLIVLAAVGIIWVVISGFLQSSSEKIALGFNLVSLDIVENSARYVQGDIVKLDIKRDSNPGNITGVRVIIENAQGDIVRQDIDTPIKELETSRIEIPLNGSITDPIKVTIAPIVGTEKRKYVSDSTDEASIKNSNALCDNNLDCNDNNEYTQDTCNSPGTISASCSYENITCLDSSDCSDPDPYTIDTCNSPGTTSSSCTHQQIECIGDGDCNDNLFCNGNETCNLATNTCQDNADPCTADSYSCTTTCDENSDICNVPNNAICDDGNSCTTNTCVGIGGDVNGCTLVPSMSCLPKQSNIVLYLPFENGAVDLSGKNNPGTINGPVVSQGISGKAYKFDGINDRIEFADDPDIRLSPLGYAISAWVKMDGSNADTSDLGSGPLHIEVIINKLNAESSILRGYNMECRLFAPEPNCLFSYSNGNSNPFVARRATSTNIINQNQWVMMTAVFNLTHSTLYINGNKVNTTANVGFFSPSTSLPLWIGDDYTFQNRVWNGSIDEVLIYNTPLTDQEVQNIYNSFN